MPLQQAPRRMRAIAGAGGAADQSAPADGKTSLTDIVKALDPCRELLNLHLCLAAGGWKLHGAHL